jgi:hypothetical protein
MNTTASRLTIATRLYVGKPRYGGPGPLYHVRVGSPSGPVIVEASTEPLLAGCRALLAMGITGPVELWDSVRSFPRLAGDIATLAALTVNESEASFRRWKPFPGVTGAPKTAKRIAGLSQQLEKAKPPS